MLLCLRLKLGNVHGWDIGKKVFGGVYDISNKNMSDFIRLGSATQVVKERGIKGIYAYMHKRNEIPKLLRIQETRNPLHKHNPSTKPFSSNKEISRKLRIC